MAHGEVSKNWRSETLGTEGISFDKLREDFFSRIIVSKKVLTLAFRTVGPRYGVTRNGEDARVSQYGEFIIVQPGGSLRIAARGMALTIAPLPRGFERYGYHIREQMDMRMHEKGIMVYEAYMVVLPSLAAGEEEPIAENRIPLIQPNVDELRRLVERDGR